MIKHLSNGDYCFDILEEQVGKPSKKDQLSSLKMQLYEDHQEVRDLRAMKSKASGMKEKKSLFARIREAKQAIEEKRYQIALLA